MRLSLPINVRGELFSVTLTFAATIFLRLGSSVVMSRLLYPEAYGLLAILMSILFAIQMLSDIGVTGFVVRHERGDDQRVINTLWTLKFIRCMFNAILLFALAPWIGRLYGDPLIGEALRVLSFIFVLFGLESMGYVIAARHKRARVIAYIELACTTISTLVTIAIAYAIRNHWALVISVLLQRALMTVCSYFVYPDRRPRFELERAILRPILDFAKFVMPASMLTLALTQYDKLVFLRFFDLSLMGLYGLAQNISGTVSSLVMRISTAVLYPRCAQLNREAPHLLRERLYLDNRRMLVLLLGSSAFVGGAAPQIVQFLYDPRYEFAGYILRVMMLRVTLETLLTPSLAIMTAVGYVKGELVSSTLRLASMLVFSIAGFAIGGFKGFLVGMALEPALALAYITRKRYIYGLGHARLDIYALILLITFWIIASVSAQFISEMVM